MKPKIVWLITVPWFAVTVWARAAEPSNKMAYESTRAVIVVTGMRLNEDPADYRKDLSVAEDATVRVTARGGATREKKTVAFARRNGPVHFTADFEVDLDATYDITMTFRDGTIIHVPDYRLPHEWKTHFYFHSTTGTLSPSSILRIGEDPQTKLRCHVYAVYPLDSYRKLGGKQLQ